MSPAKPSKPRFSHVITVSACIVVVADSLRYLLTALFFG